MANNNSRKRYPRQVVLMLSTEMGDVIDQVAEQRGLTKAEVERAFLLGGMRAAGYSPATHDGTEVTLDDVAGVRRPEPEPAAEPVVDPAAAEAARRQAELDQRVTPARY